MQPSATGDVRDSIDKALTVHNTTINNVTSQINDPQRLQAIDNRARTYSPMDEAQRAAQNQPPQGGPGEGGGDAPH